MRPTLATAAKRRWQKLPENSRPPGPYRARCVASRRQPRAQARTSLAIAASHALIWPIIGKRLGGDDVRRSLGSARVRVDTRGSRGHGEDASRTIAGVRRSSSFALRSENSAFCAGYGRRALRPVLQGRCAEIVSLRSELARRRSDAQRATRIGELGRAAPDGIFSAGSRVGRSRGATGKSQTRNASMKANAVRFAAAACAGRRWRAASRLRPIFSAGDDHCPAAGAKLRHAEACTKAAARQAETSGRHAPTGEAGGALSRPDIRAGLGRRQRRRIHGRNHVGLPDRRSVLNAAVAPQFIQAPRNSEL